MNADGSGQRRLTRSTTADIIPSWSPDGRKIAFDGGDTDPRHERRRKRKAAPDAQRRNGAGRAVWSLDGRKIAFTGGDRKGLDVYVMNADGSGQRRLTRRPVDRR